MNTFAKSKQRDSQVNLASPLRSQKHNLRAASILTPFLRHLNTGTLAFVMFVSLAVLSPIRGRDFENAGSAAANQGYLQVFSATDEFDDGGLSYYAHSSYAIYTNDGKLFKNIENHLSRSDEIPEVVALPIGYYTVEARSGSKGYISVRLVIKAGQRTILDLDLGEKQTPIRGITAKNLGNKIGTNR
jgi:hypothetical protein